MSKIAAPLTFTSETPVSAWSFNRLLSFERCPASLFFSAIQKVKGPKAEAANRGIVIHENASQFIKGEIDKLIPELTFFAKQLTQLRDLRKHPDRLTVHTEEPQAYDKDFNRVDWFDKSVWLRYAYDIEVLGNPVGEHGFLYDIKSGKLHFNHVKHTRQKQLYCALQLRANPALETSTGIFVYTDEKRTTEHTFTRPQGERLLQSYLRKGVELTSTTSFITKPSKMACKFCPYKPSELNLCPVGVSD